MNKSEFSERDICTKYILPALDTAGWDIATQIREEFEINAGRIIVRGNLVTRGRRGRADIVLCAKPNIPIAVIEAKDNTHSLDDGMQQALRYAERLQVPFAISSNGDGFIVHDRTGTTTPWPEKPEDQLEAEEELLQRLVDLNHQRAAEEAKGKFRYLRPNYQAPEQSAQQSELATDEPKTAAKRRSGPDPGPSAKRAWPKSLQEQIRSVRNQLAAAPMDVTTLASHYKRNPEKSVTQVLEALAELGMVKTDAKGQFQL